MRRFLLGFALALAVAVPATLAAAPSGDQTIKGNLTVSGSATITGDTFTRSVQAQSGVISNFNTLDALTVLGDQVNINAGGNGFGWIDPATGTVQTRIVAGGYQPPFPALPVSSLLIQRNADGTATLWFETGSGVWTRVAG